MSKFFNELMESVQQMNEILRDERVSLPRDLKTLRPGTIKSVAPSSRARQLIRSAQAQPDTPQ
ncbi:hypothetical protein [Pseudomonas laurylsulfatiphila]|uniref:hypothetical protein n=1 Tax=Pseudomonas laurylsulfatiphila TaxID=2011015 RepID=UPI003D1F2048|nr:hypothetical protein [Pseudomonas reinekei]MDF9904484.1 hypothetical protein [Pseudomonas reinekei]